MLVSRCPTWSETVFVTPEKAKQMREDHAFHRQRKINDDNIIRLGVEMECGRFVQGTQVFIAVLPDGETRYLLNANHSLEAIQLSGKGQWLTITFLHVKDEAEAAFVYAVLDTQKIRTWLDALRATGKNEDVPFPSQFLAALGIIAAGFPLLKSDWVAQVRNKSRHLRLSLVEEYRDAGSLIAAAIQRTDNARIVRRAAVLAVALVTAKYQPSTAGSFWRSLAKDEGLVEGDPERALLRYLRNNPPGGAGARIPHQKAAAAAWNAYFEGRPIAVVKPTQMHEFRILGTPWETKAKTEKKPEEDAPYSAVRRRLLAQRREVRDEIHS